MRRVPRKQLADPYFKALFYGDPGSGKTRTVATAAADPRCSPVLLLNMGGNPISIRDYEQIPDILELERLSDLNVPYDWLRTGQDPKNEFAVKYELTPPYKTVIVDSITEIQRESFRTVIGTTNTGPGSIPQTAEIQHFNKVLAQMTTFARLFYGLPMNVLLTSLERYDKDEITGAMTLRPLLWGQSSMEVGGYAYVVARLVHRARLDNKLRMDIQKTAKAVGVTEDPVGVDVTTVALFTPTGKYVAKDQYGALGSYMIDPTIPRMLDMVYGGT